MDTSTPPQARGQLVIPSTAVRQQSSIWNQPTNPVNTPSSYNPRYAPTTAMPQTPSKAQSWRVVGSPTTPPGALPSPRVSPEAAPSVKHLTCYFWNAHGKCKHSNEDCLYAHYHTGQIADPPVQVEPGRPAVAGRNAMTARPVYENWRDQHGNYGLGVNMPNMPTAMQTRISHQIENLHEMARKQSTPYLGHPPNGKYQAPNSVHRGQPPISPTFVREATDPHPSAYSSTPEVSYERMTGNLCTLAGDLYHVIDKSHDSFAQAVVTLHAQCESLLKQAQNLYRANDPKPKACIETLVGAVSAIMPLIDQQKVMAAETEDAKHGVVENMKGAGLGYMARSWQTARSDSGGTL